MEQRTISAKARKGFGYSALSKVFAKAKGKLDLSHGYCLANCSIVTTSRLNLITFCLVPNQGHATHNITVMSTAEFSITVTVW